VLSAPNNQSQSSRSGLNKYVLVDWKTVRKLMCVNLVKLRAGVFTKMGHISRVVVNDRVIQYSGTVKGIH